MKKDTNNFTINPNHIGSPFENFVKENFSPDEIKGAINKMCAFDDIITEEY